MRTFKAIVASCAVLSMLPAAPARATSASGTALGDETRVNQTTAGAQHTPAIARDTDGDYVVVWQGNGPGDNLGIFARLYDASGTPQTDEFLVNMGTTSNQSQPDVAMDAAGNFVVAWSSFENGTDLNVHNRVFNANGSPRTPGTVAANAYTTNDQWQTAVAMDAAGNFVQVWHGEGTGDSAGVFAQRFDSNGNAVGSAIRANTTTSGMQNTPDVAMDADGNFVVAWTGTDQEGTGNAGVYAQRFTSAGAAVGSELHVNSYTTGTQAYPAVAMSATGEFIIAWYSFDGTSHDAYHVRYSNTGVRDAGETAASKASASHQAYTPSVAMDPLGNFVVVWGELSSGGDYDVRAQLHVPSGYKDAQTISQAAGASQQYGAVAMDGNGGFVVAFDSGVQDGDSYGIYARSYSGVENVDLGLVLTDSADPVAANGNYGYTATITNHHTPLTPRGLPNRDAAYAGIGTAAAFTVTFALPAGTSAITGSGTSWNCGGTTTLVCDFGGKLAPGASTTVTASLTAPAAGGTANANAALSRGPQDATTSNDSDAESTTITPPPPDTTPDAFAFSDQTGVEPGAQVTSDSLAISGINQPAAISVSNGSYSIGCTATFTAGAGTIDNGQTVCVRHTASAGFSTAVDTTLTIGGVSDAFRSTTRPPDTTPDAFSFIDQPGIATGIAVTSNVVTIAGIEAPAAISVAGGEYSIGCDGSFVASPGTIADGQTVCVRHTSATAAATETSTVLIINGISDTFTSTTAPAADAASGGGGAMGSGVLALFGLLSLARVRRRVTLLLILLCAAPAHATEQCGRDSDCDDGIYCNGVERCSPGSPAADPRGCVVASTPPCTFGQYCSEPEDRCENSSPGPRDADGDGVESIEAGGADCDDTDPNRYPGNQEVSDVDGHDEDCDPMTYAGTDLDQDGYVSDRYYNTTPSGYRIGGQDCDDTAPDVHPTEAEMCNGIDDNCNGRVDEGMPQFMLYPDADADGFGKAGVGPILLCLPSPGLAANANDCDDSDAAVFPGSSACNGKGGVSYCASSGEMKTGACETGSYCMSQPSGSGVCVPAKPAPQPLK